LRGKLNSGTQFLMPLFFFHVTVADETSADEVGTDLPDRDAARAEAFRATGEMLRDESGSLPRHVSWRMHVTDSIGARVTSLHLQEE
jgi:hypothetical protein